MDVSNFSCTRISDETLENIWSDIFLFTGSDCDMHLFLNKMDILRNHTCQNCLPHDKLDILIHILSSNFINRTGIDREVISLINNFVPEGVLEESQTDKIFLWLLLTAFQADEGAVHLIHWLILAIENGLIKADYVGKNYYFSCLNFLKNENLVIPLSVLLKNITRRNHCITFWIKRVLNIMNELSDRTHKSYVSNLVREMLKHNQNFNHVKLFKPPSKHLKHPDSLRINFDVIKYQLDLNSHQVEADNEVSMDSQASRLVQNSIPVEEQVPNEVEIIKGLPKIMYNTSCGKRLFDIHNLKEMVSNWGRVIPPSVSLCSLSNDLGLTFIKFAPSDWREKFHSEVEIVLDLIKNNINREDIDPRVFLERLALLQTTVQASLPCVSKFFTDYLTVWDTVSFREPLINFIPWLYFDSIEEMKLTMQRLLNVFACGDLSFKLDILKGFGQLYSNMVVVHLRNSKLNNEREIFVGQAWLKEDPFSFLKCFIKIVEVFFNSALVCHSLSSSVLLEAITFYHTVSQIQMIEEDINCFTIIPSIIVLSSIFSSIYPVIEQLCSIMNWYINTVVPKLREVESPNNYSDVLQNLELYTKEMITFLWNEKECIDFDDTMIGQVIGKEMISYMKSSSFGIDNPIQIHNHPAFATFFTETKNAFNFTQSFTKNDCMDILKKIGPQCSAFLENNIKTQRTTVNNQEKNKKSATLRI